MLQGPEFELGPGTQMLVESKMFLSFSVKDLS